jgi:hypothetical protein
MRFRMDKNIQITVRAAVGTGFTLTGEPQPRTVVHAGGNSHGHFFPGQHLALPSAGFAWIGDHLPWPRQ